MDGNVRYVVSVHTDIEWNGDNDEPGLCWLYCHLSSYATMFGSDETANTRSWKKSQR
jgi:hypothetical protein